MLDYEYGKRAFREFVQDFHGTMDDLKELYLAEPMFTDLFGALFVQGWMDACKNYMAVME